MVWGVKKFPWQNLMVLVNSFFVALEMIKFRIFKDDDKKNFCSCYEKIFQTDAEEIWSIVESAKRQKHGTMLLFTENAPMESIRLSKAGYQVAVNKTMNNRWIKALGEIDGAMLLDQYGKLYMIGVILDGDVNIINHNYL